MEKKRFILDGTNNRAVDEDRIKTINYILQQLNGEGLTEELKEKGLKIS